MTEFARRLKERRIKAGLTQAQFARKIGVTVDGVRHWEQGRRYPRPRPLSRIAKFFNTTVARLAG